jgi:hypothetical protein
VEAIAPNTEADKAALLITMLVGVGNMIGRSAHFRVGGARHALNLFAVLVGNSAKGRKGQSKHDIGVFLEQVDPGWWKGNQASGLSSGEGLIHRVRDPICKKQAVKDPKTKEIRHYQEEVVDEGVYDKRLFVIESEFGLALKIAAREGNVLSAIVRLAWDGDPLRILTKNNPETATGAHISILGHITRDELVRHLTETDQVNGFANRFLWIAVQRSQLLPHGGDVRGSVPPDRVEELREGVEFAKRIGEITRDDAANALWEAVYKDLTREESGLFAALTARDAPMVMRIGCLFAVIDQRTTVGVHHLRAALEIVRYSGDSVKYIFGDALGDPSADTIDRALRHSPEGLTRTEIMDLFKRHKPAAEIERALGYLQAAGRANVKQVQSSGRPTELWSTTARAAGGQQ